jgi:hypothetical protein
MRDVLKRLRVSKKEGARPAHGCEELLEVCIAELRHGWNAAFGASLAGLLFGAAV